MDGWDDLLLKTGLVIIPAVIRELELGCMTFSIPYFSCGPDDLFIHRYRNNLQIETPVAGKLHITETFQWPELLVNKVLIKSGGLLQIFGI